MLSLLPELSFDSGNEGSFCYSSNFTAIFLIYPFKVRDEYKILVYVDVFKVLAGYFTIILNIVVRVSLIQYDSRLIRPGTL